MTKVLDITDAKETGLMLKQAILSAVKDTQRIILAPLPDQLLMTKDQYDMLQDDPDMQKMYQSDNLLYITPLNAMEVKVKQ